MFSIRIFFHLKVDISLSIDIFFIHRDSKFLAQVHRDLDGRKRILFALITLQKRNVSLLFWVHKNQHRVFTDSKDVLGYFYLYDQTLRSILRASERTGACPAASATVQLHTPHTYTSIAYISLG